MLLKLNRRSLLCLNSRLVVDVEDLEAVGGARAFVVVGEDGVDSLERVEFVEYSRRGSVQISSMISMSMKNLEIPYHTTIVHLFFWIWDDSINNVNVHISLTFLSCSSSFTVPYLNFFLVSVSPSWTLFFHNLLSECFSFFQPFSITFLSYWFQFHVLNLKL